MKKPLLFCTVLLALLTSASAQDFRFGVVSAEELNMKSYGGDTSAHAVVLQEYGKSRINVVSDDNIKLIYQYHVKIKIFDSKAFDKGTVQIPVYNNSDADSYEEVNDIKAVTYYRDDNGNTQKVELENKKIYPVKETKHYANYKFAIPGIRNGCVIEYSYTIETPYWEFFRSWKFQDDIPKISSLYEVHIPAFWTYHVSLKGYLKLSKNTSEVESKCFETHGASCDCSFITYGMDNIPAFVEDEYMTSSKNYMSAINFELVDFTNPYTGAKNKYTKEWKDIDQLLKSDYSFGGQLKRKSLLKDKVLAITAGKTNDLDKAKAIYTAWQKYFKWNDRYSMQSIDGISKAMDAHTGNSGDINLSLVTALSAAGLNAEAVLLSTRDNGVINTLYPVLNDFDYVIAKINIGDQSYLLDATDPLLPFGMLPFRCLNDKGRVMSLDKPSYFIDLNLPQREKNTYNLIFTLQDDGKLKGSIIHYSMGYEAYLKRKAIKKFNSKDEYVDDFSSKMPKVKIISSEILNIDSLDQPVCEKYEVTIDLFDKLNGNKLTFNPFLWNKITTNPFKLTQRSYPVDWGMPSEDRYILTVKLPANYSVETPPPVNSVAMPENGGKFITYYEPGDNSFSFSNVLIFNKGIYSSDEYPYLKELYNKVIQSERAEMVFKKK